MKEITIPLSKKKIALSFSASITFVILSLLLIQITSTIYRYLFLISIIFFGTLAIFLFIKFFDRKPGLVINHEGIIDNSSALSAGLIRWDDVVDIDVLNLSGQKMVMIKLRNPNQILSRQSILKRIVMKLNENFFGSPVFITPNILNCNFEELYDTLKKQSSLYLK